MIKKPFMVDGSCMSFLRMQESQCPSTIWGEGVGEGISNAPLPLWERVWVRGNVGNGVTV